MKNKILLLVIIVILMIIFLLYKYSINRREELFFYLAKESINKSINSANIFSSGIIELIYTLYKYKNETSSTIMEEDKRMLEEGIIKIIDNLYNISFSRNFCKGLLTKELLIDDIDIIKGGTVMNIGHLIRRYNEIGSNVYNIKVQDMQQYYESQGFTPIEVRVIIKKVNGKNIKENIKVSEYKEYIESILTKGYKTSINHLTISIGDVLHDVLISSYLNSIYDVGECPHLLKWYGIYGCKEDDIIYTISEEASITLYDFLIKVDIYVGELSNKYLEATTAGLDTTLLNEKGYKISNIVFTVIIEVMISIFYTISYLKDKLNIRHFDLHTKNIMLQFNSKKYMDILFSDEILTEEIVIDSFYQTKRLNMMGWYKYKFNNKEIIIPNIGFITKIIDFGVSSFKLPINFETINPPPYITHIGPEKDGYYKIQETEKTTRINEYAYYTNEVIFFLLNLIQVLKGLYNLKKLGIQTRIDPVMKEILDDLEDNGTSNKVGAGGSFYFYAKSSDIYPGSSIRGDRIMNRRDVYHEEKYSISKKYQINNYYFLEKMFDMLPKLSSTTSIYQIEENINNDEIMTFTLERETNLPKPWNQFLKSCSTKDCNTKLSPVYTIEQPIVSSLDIPKNILLKEDLEEISDSGIYYGYYNIQPNLQKISNMSVKDKMNYYSRYIIKEDIIWFNYSKISNNKYMNDKIGKLYPSVNLHTLLIEDKSNEIKIFSEIGKDLLTVGESIKEKEIPNVIINGGYFIVRHNVMDPLQVSYNIKKSEAMMKKLPIGYYMSKNILKETISNTIIEIPEQYKEYFMEIIIVRDGNKDRIKMMKYREFQAQHELEIKYQLIQIKRIDDKFNEIKLIKDEESNESTVIKIPTTVIKHNSKGLPIIAKHSNIKKYKIAMTSGPILIYDGDIIYTKENEKILKFNTTKLKDELLDFNDYYNAISGGIDIFNKNEISYIINEIPSDEGYRVSSYANNDLMFLQEEGEWRYPYGQRVGTQLIQHSVLIEFKNGNHGVIIVESRGYMTYGITRSQLSEIIYKQVKDVKHAVCLDGGFSANMLIGKVKKTILYNKDGGDSGYNYFYAMQDPERREIGMSLIIM